MFALAFDTETTGMVDWQGEPTADTQPELVQLAAILYDLRCPMPELRSWREVAMMSVIVRPEGWIIPAEASQVHGIDQATAEYLGIGRDNAMLTFCDLAARADVILAHNIDFDRVIVEAAKFRVDRAAGVEYQRPWQPHHQPLCTKLAATDVVQIPKTNGREGWKWPSLNECYQFFYAQDVNGAHDALVDVRACVNVFYELVELGHFPEYRFEEAAA